MTRTMELPLFGAESIGGYAVILPTPLISASSPEPWACPPAVWGSLPLSSPPSVWGHSPRPGCPLTCPHPSLPDSMCLCSPSVALRVLCFCLAISNLPCFYCPAHSLTLVCFCSFIMFPVAQVDAFSSCVKR